MTRTGTVAVLCAASAAAGGAFTAGLMTDAPGEGPQARTAYAVMSASRLAREYVRVSFYEGDLRLPEEQQEDTDSIVAYACFSSLAREYGIDTSPLPDEKLLPYLVRLGAILEGSCAGIVEFEEWLRVDSEAIIAGAGAVYAYRRREAEENPVF